MLAILGGEPAIKSQWPLHPVVGSDEFDAVKRVFDRNQFSEFIASAGDNFFGGIEIHGLEASVANYARCDHGVAYNSWTSGLHAAVAAIGASYNDKILVSPYSFTSSATCALMNNCLPIFVDVDPQTCNISIKSLEEAIIRYPDAKAVVVVHLFGMPADMDSILALCSKHNIAVIEDCAQAPGAEYKGQKVGSLGACGGFSFTQSKTVMCGEGGVLVTNDESIATVAKMMRNHGEVIDSTSKRTYNSQILGMGYRMTEIDAAIGKVQWGKLDKFNQYRIEVNCEFKDFIGNACDFISFQDAPYHHKHVYYATPMLFDENKAGISRERFIEMLTAEGIKIYGGYVRPLYLQNLYQHRTHHILANNRYVDYSKGICPNAENLHYKKFMAMFDLRPYMAHSLLQEIKVGFQKVIDYIT